jgi:hypothetical protein
MRVVYLHECIGNIQYDFEHLASYEQLTQKPANTLRTAIRKYPYIAIIAGTDFNENGIFFLTSQGSLHTPMN